MLRKYRDPFLAFMNELRDETRQPGDPVNREELYRRAGVSQAEGDLYLAVVEAGGKALSKEHGLAVKAGIARAKQRRLTTAASTEAMKHD